MKLFLTIVTVGKMVGGVAGPLPYDMDQCLKYAHELRSQQDVFLYVHPEKMEAPGPFTFVCKELDQRPDLGSRWVE